MQYLVEVICDVDGTYEFPLTSIYATYDDALAAANKEKNDFLKTGKGAAYRDDLHSRDSCFLEHLGKNGVAVIQDPTGNDRMIFRVVGIH